MTRRIDNVDLCILIDDRRIFGEDGDAAFPLQIIGVHHTLRNLLVRAKNAALLQELIHQGSLPMVDVGNDGDISQVVSYIHI